MTRKHPDAPHPTPAAAPEHPEAAAEAGVTPLGTAEPAGPRPRPSVPPTEEDQIESGFDNMPV